MGCNDWRNDYESYSFWSCIFNICSLSYFKLGDKMSFETEFKTTKMNGSSRIYISKDIRDKLKLEEGEKFKIKTDKENKSILLEVIK